MQLTLAVELDTVATWRPSTGLITSNVAPSEASVHAPPMKFFAARTAPSPNRDEPALHTNQTRPTHPRQKRRRTNAPSARPSVRRAGHCKAVGEQGNHNSFAERVKTHVVASAAMVGLGVGVECHVEARRASP